MKNSILSFIFLLTSFSPKLYSQNCNVFLAEGDTCKYKACNFTENAPRVYQFTRAYQEKHDKALDICPNYDEPYRDKSVPYLKSGDFLTWKKLMDKAVELNPEEHLGYRGWCRFQFFNDYIGAIKDLEQLDRLVPYDIGYSQNGTYHLNIAKALCYKKLGKKEKALSIMEQQIQVQNYSIGLFDYLHLGVLHLELGNYTAAENALSAQSTENELAENQFYLARLKQIQNNQEQAQIHLEKAKALYFEERFMFDPYAHQVDKVYLIEIEEALGRIN